MTNPIVSGLTAPTSVGNVALSAAQALINGAIETEINTSGDLTVHITTLSGDDPSVYNPVYVAFRNATLSTGNYVLRAITAAMSIRVPSGNKLGTSNGVPFRFWVLIADDGGTLRLALVNCYKDTHTILKLPEGGLLSSSAISGSGSEQVVYSETAFTSKPFRRVAYLTWEAGLTTAGDYSDDPDVIHMVRYGSPGPGDVVNEWVKQQAAYNSGTATINLDDSIPEAGEGNELMSVPTTTTSTANVLEHEALINCSYSVASPLIGFLSIAAGNAFACGWADCPAADTLCQIHLMHRHLNTLGGSEYECHAGGSNAGTFYFNGYGGSRKLGGVLTSFYRVRELMG